MSSSAPDLARRLLADREQAMTIDDHNVCASFPAALRRRTFALSGGERVSETVLDVAMKCSLEDRMIVNWWLDPQLNLACQLPRLHPIDTDADGDCLLHSLSLALVGVHDRGLTLRKALHSSLKGASGEVFRARWQMAQDDRNKTECEGFELSADQWDAEWDNLVVRAGEKGRSLEDLHVLTMAHVLSRPIVVYSDKVLEGVAGDAISTNQMGGLYLPLEIDASECEKDPLFVAYRNGHFVPLVTEARDRKTSGSHDMKQQQQQQQKQLMPIQWRHGAAFDIRFHLPGLDGPSSDCIAKYLCASHVLLPDGRKCLCAERDVVVADDAAQAICQGLLANLSAGPCVCACACVCVCVRVYVCVIELLIVQLHLQMALAGNRAWPGLLPPRLCLPRLCLPRK